MADREIEGVVPTREARSDLVLDRRSDFSDVAFSMDAEAISMPRARSNGLSA